MKRIKSWILHFYRDYFKLNANDRQFRAQMRAFHIKIEQVKKEREESCPHLQGSHELSDSTLNYTSIIWHYFDDKILRGICTNCGRIFKPEDPDYKLWFNKKSGNLMSTCGIPIPTFPTRGEDYYTKYTDNDLDSLSDEEIFKLMEDVRTLRKKNPR